MQFLEVSTLQGPELHLDVSALQRSVLLLEVSTQQGPELEVSTLQGPELHLDVSTLLLLLLSTSRTLLPRLPPWDYNTLQPPRLPSLSHNTEIDPPVLDPWSVEWDKVGATFCILLASCHSGGKTVMVPS